MYEDEKEDSDLPISTPLHHPLLSPGGPCEEDPQAILDDHLSRVLKTPGCQSPGVARHSPRSQSPDRPGALIPSFLGPYPGGPKGILGSGGRPSTKHIHHHYIHHHHAGPRTKEQIEADAAQRVQCLCPPGGADYSNFSPGYGPYDSTLPHPLSWLSQTPAHPITAPPKLKHTFTCWLLSKIGRASCRERVSSPV